ncbi:MAG: DciA family protein [Pasteurellaceae bacterium]|nr:DciA family protein [Pasteurellaceae bacterium]
MKIQPTKNIADILHHSSLAKLVARSNEINTINLQIQRLLPQSYRKLYRITHLYDNLLHIDVANSMVRQGFLFQQRELLGLIQAEFPHIQRIEITINPNALQI